MTYDKICENCKKKYKTPIFWAKFCSNKCRVSAWRKGQKKKK